jgi:serine/threonine protein phosphatase 1
MEDFIKLTNRPSGKRYVIPDIHGCFKTFRRLVEELIRLSKSDHLFLLGDYVDRGPSSQAVLDYILDLMDEGFKLYPLRGNHEDDLLDYAKGELRFLLWHLNRYKFPEIVQKEKLMEKYFHFFNNLPYYYELEDYYLVHAGFNFKSEKPFENRTAMLWLRYFNPPSEMLNGKKVIHGHDPVPMRTIVEHINRGYATIPLDNGVAYMGKHRIYETSEMGSLCAFDMDHRVLFSQRNIDM